MNQQPPTVLVIEDDHDMAELIACFLVDAKIRAVIAAKGITGLEQARLLLPSLILCDSCMPGMDGLRVLEMLRANPVTAKIPIVLISGHEAARFDGSGADGFLQKPFQMTEMLAVLRSFLTKRPPDTDLKHDRPALECA
jgi:DNA-binding response OmpR family regulator